ncbi:helix-turn-helix domain-containing protein [Neorhizobium sp. T786]|uniref:helix-turn-helix domain-containing protein n=1 Tax=Pseudorhizobium xiangyangii TaxID=2883104 RepID=UPI001CFF7265|nr:helix-turn-helix domain-containing protein [Neorhizobium xiangyangii]MCB5201666.1 helix-turn-helix domain-containing protein [Neorhizobium xiangyangii]
MTVSNDKNQREFALLFDQSRLSQTKLSRLLGVSVMTVNRWLSDRDDAVDPPYYALSFLRVFLMLPEAARSRIPEKPKK